MLLSVQMIKSLNKLGLVEQFLQDVSDNSIPTTGQEIGKNGLGVKEPVVMFGHPTGLDNKKITLLEIPTGNPLLVNLNLKQEVTACKYLNQERARDLPIF